MVPISAVSDAGFWSVGVGVVNRVVVGTPNRSAIRAINRSGSSSWLIPSFEGSDDTDAHTEMVGGLALGVAAAVPEASDEFGVEEHHEALRIRVIDLMYLLDHCSMVRCCLGSSFPYRLPLHVLETTGRIGV